MAKKKTETVVVTWRVKEALRRRLEAAAADNEVSVNAEITRRIEESFARTDLTAFYENTSRRAALLGLAMAWDRLAAEEENKEKAKSMSRTADRLIWMAEDKEPGLPIPPRVPAETNEERQARLRAAHDDLLKNAERSDARSADDAGQREWDTRSVPARSLSDQEAKRAKERGHIRRRGEHS